LSGYDIVFFGSPVWFGDVPDLVALFLSQADFKGKPVALFATAGSQPRQVIESLTAKIQNGSIVGSGLLQKRADDHTQAVVAEKVNAWLTEIKALVDAK
jgi:flavodoxin